MMPLNKKFPEASANTLYASSELIEKIIELDGGPDRKIFHNSLQ
jgi:bacterioferritin (cytochrome b1)